MKKYFKGFGKYSVEVSTLFDIEPETDYEKSKLNGEREIANSTMRILKYLFHGFRE